MNDHISIPTADGERAEGERRLSSLGDVDRQSFRVVVVRCPQGCGVAEVYVTPSGNVLRARGRAHFPGTVETLAAAGEPKPARSAEWQAWPVESSMVEQSPTWALTCSHGTWSADPRAIVANTPATRQGVVRLAVSDVESRI